MIDMKQIVVYQQMCFSVIQQALAIFSVASTFPAANGMYHHWTTDDFPQIYEEYRDFSPDWNAVVNDGITGVPVHSVGEIPHDPALQTRTDDATNICPSLEISSGYPGSPSETKHLTLSPWLGSSPSRFHATFPSYQTSPQELQKETITEALNWLESAPTNWPALPHHTINGDPSSSADSQVQTALSADITHQSDAHTVCAAPSSSVGEPAIAHNEAFLELVKWWDSDITDGAPTSSPSQDSSPEVIEPDSLLHYPNVQQQPVSHVIGNTSSSRIGSPTITPEAFIYSDRSDWATLLKILSPRRERMNSLTEPVTSAPHKNPCKSRDAIGSAEPLEASLSPSASTQAVQLSQAPADVELLESPFAEQQEAASRSNTADNPAGRVFEVPQSSFCESLDTDSVEPGSPPEATNQREVFLQALRKFYDKCDGRHKLLDPLAVQEFLETIVKVDDKPEFQRLSQFIPFVTLEISKTLGEHSFNDPTPYNLFTTFFQNYPRQIRQHWTGRIFYNESQHYIPRIVIEAAQENARWRIRALGLEQTVEDIKTIFSKLMDGRLVYDFRNRVIGASKIKNISEKGIELAFYYIIMMFYWGNLSAINPRKGLVPNGPSESITFDDPNKTIITEFNTMANFWKQVDKNFKHNGFGISPDEGPSLIKRFADCFARRQLCGNYYTLKLAREYLSWWLYDNLHVSEGFGGIEMSEEVLDRVLDFCYDCTIVDWVERSRG